MLFCCCRSLRRPCCFVVLIVTLIFHIYEIIGLGENFREEKWSPIVLMCHLFATYTTVNAFRGVYSKDEKPLLVFLIFAVFGFIPILIDMGFVIADKKIFMFYTSYLESRFGLDAAEFIVFLILFLVFVLKCDFTAVVYQYYTDLRTNFTPADSSCSWHSCRSLLSNDES